MPEVAHGAPAAVPKSRGRTACRSPPSSAVMRPDAAMIARSLSTSSVGSPAAVSRSSSSSSSSSQALSRGGRLARTIAGCWVGSILSDAAQELLVQLLARAGAGELDRGCPVVGLLARQPDHLPRQVEDLHRLAHVQHEQMAAVADAPACTISATASGMVMK